jgi:hypothetical protein
MAAVELLSASSPIRWFGGGELFSACIDHVLINKKKAIGSPAGEHAHAGEHKLGQGAPRRRRLVVIHNKFL